MRDLTEHGRIAHFNITGHSKSIIIIFLLCVLVKCHQPTDLPPWTSVHWRRAQPRTQLHTWFDGHSSWLWQNCTPALHSLDPVDLAAQSSARVSRKLLACGVVPTHMQEHTTTRKVMTLKIPILPDGLPSYFREVVSDT